MYLFIYRNIFFFTKYLFFILFFLIEVDLRLSSKDKNLFVKYPILIYTNNKTRVNDQWFLHNNQLQDIVNLLPPNTSFKNFVDHYTFVENNHELFQQGFLQIVTETVYDYPAIFYTEKTFKPIVNKRPFVMLGVAGSIK